MLMQNAARRRKAVQEREARVLERAALRVQNAWNMYNLRMDAMDEADELRRRKRLYALFMRIENAAATRMQRAFRARALDRVIENAAAIPLQSAARSLFAKKAAAAKRSEATADDAEGQKQREWEKKIVKLLARGERRAAMRIQLAFWRWHIWRAERAEAAALGELEAEAAAATATQAAQEATSATSSLPTMASCRDSRICESGARCRSYESGWRIIGCST